MDNTWFLAALWVGLALVATLFAIWFRISTALSEIVVGTVAQLIIGVVIGGAGLGAQTPWVGFLAGTGAIVLTFLAGVELDPGIFRIKWKEATVVGLAGFFAPFLGSAAIAYYGLGWEPMPSWLAGVALSTTSVAMVYAVMLELVRQGNPGGLLVALAGSRRTRPSAMRPCGSWRRVLGNRPGSISSSRQAFVCVCVFSELRLVGSCCP
jgi:glutathione-regulated potassium-efflux system ancillary protein KefC